MTEFIVPSWPIPSNVRSLITVRTGGVSKPPFASFNLGDHVGDEIRDVETNRKRLIARVGYPISWLQQTHSVNVAELKHNQHQAQSADGAYCDSPGIACAILSADCLPILLADASGKQIAAVHAGWRGLAGGIIQQALRKFKPGTTEVMAYLGPAISVNHFEVGEDVLLAFSAAEQTLGFALPVHTFFHEKKNSPSGEKKFLADLCGLARSQLAANGVSNVYGGDCCTYDDPRFYSFRREGRTGRIASLIWRDD